MKYTKTVQEYLEKHEDRRDELQMLRKILLKLPFEECIKWGMPTYTINGKNVVGIGSFKNWSCLWFHQGAFIDDHASILENAQEGKTKGMRQWRFSSSKEIDEHLVTNYLEKAIANQKQGKEIKPSKKQSKRTAIPVILNEYLNNNLNHLKTFESFTISQQNDFSNYIIEAKREKTKLDRLEKIKDLLEQRKKLNSLWEG